VLVNMMGLYTHGELIFAGGCLYTEVYRSYISLPANFNLLIKWQDSLSSGVRQGKKSSKSDACVHIASQGL
jgi:hypothetical protein